MNTAAGLGLEHGSEQSGALLPWVDPVGGDREVLPWINPVGGLGDTLLLSGVLAKVRALDETRSFDLVRRTKYVTLLKGHPAIRSMGFPPRDATLLTTHYWSLEQPGPGLARPFQILCRLFGLPTPQEEVLYLPDVPETIPTLFERIPWGRKTLLLAPASDSTRKMLPPATWETVTERLAREGVTLLNLGRRDDPPVRGAWSLRGTTRAREVPCLLRRVDGVITSDSFVLHAAHLVGAPAVALWGPTDPAVYGYPEQVHLRGAVCDAVEDCITPRFSGHYGTPCPLGDGHCMARIHPDAIVEAALALIRRA